MKLSTQNISSQLDNGCHGLGEWNDPETQIVGKNCGFYILSELGKTIPRTILFPGKLL